MYVLNTYVYVHVHYKMSMFVALLRKAISHDALKEYKHAIELCEEVLKQEPNNKRAQELLNATREKYIPDESEDSNKKKKKGTRLKIEEVEDKVLGSQEAAKKTKREVVEKGMEKDRTEKEDQRKEEKDSQREELKEQREEEVVCKTDIDKKVTDKDKNTKKEATVTSSSEVNHTSNKEFECHLGNVNTQKPEEVSQGTQEIVSSVVPPLPPRIQILKDGGNDLFRTGQYAAALKKYSDAIKLLETG